VVNLKELKLFEILFFAAGWSASSDLPCWKNCENCFLQTLNIWN